jgi:hypothetical protein
MLMPSSVKVDGKTCNQRTSSFSSTGGGLVILKVWAMASHKLNDTFFGESEIINMSSAFLPLIRHLRADPYPRFH